MSDTDSRLSVTHELVVKDGPRALWRAVVGRSYMAVCGDCGEHLTVAHRIDAEDWLDGHDCNAPEPMPGAWS